jgi:GR25 family glycosyltransferase involved in LPS biosynthesis
VIIHLINLDRSQDRLAEFQRVNGQTANVSRFCAVDGRTLDVASLVANGTIEQAATANYSPGAIGAALSHMALWDKAIEDGIPLTVCEDDAIFHSEFERRSEAVIATLPPDWDLISWGWNFDANLLIDFMPGISPCLCSFDQGALVAHAHDFKTRDIRAQAFPLLRSFGIPCYSISPRGAQLLKKACFPIRATQIFFPGINRHIPNCGIDVAMNDAYPKMKSYVAFPPLVITKNEQHRSTIQK